MKKNTKTFADEFKALKARYYKNRKPGDDSMTDDAFNREAKGLQQAQEAIKAQQAPEQDQQFTKGGGLPKYDGFSTKTNFLINPNKTSGLSINQDYSNFGKDAFYTPNQFQQPGFDAGLNVQVGGGQAVNQVVSQSPQGKFSPTANILGPALSIGANAISNKILKDNAEARKSDLLSNIDVNLGRVQAQQIDLGRERANIKSQAAQTEAAGRYQARGARSASEAAKIATAGRIGSQGISGSQLSQSSQREEIENARLRSEANRTNVNLQGQENQMAQRQRMAIEQQYGNVAPQLDAEFFRNTGQTVQNYIGENQRMRRDNEYLNMLNPNYELSYDIPEDANKYQRLLYNTGIKQPSRNVNVRS